MPWWCSTRYGPLPGSTQPSCSQSRTQISAPLASVIQLPYAAPWGELKMIRSPGLPSNGWQSSWTGETVVRFTAGWSKPVPTGAGQPAVPPRA